MARDSFGARVLGPSQTIPGAVDVQRADGSVVQVPDEPGLLQSLGFAGPTPLPPPPTDLAQALGFAGLPPPEERQRLRTGQTLAEVPGVQVPDLPSGEPPGSLLSREAETRQMINLARADGRLPGGTSLATQPGDTAPAGGEFARPGATDVALQQFAERQRMLDAAVGPATITVGSGTPTTTTQQTTRERLATPEAQEAAGEYRLARDEAATRQQDAILRAAEARQSAALGSSVALDALGEQLKEFDSATTQLTDEQRERAAGLLVEREDMSRRAQAEIDPGRFWGESSAGRKIGAVIGHVLSGVGAGLVSIGSGQQVRPVFAIQDAIDRDIALQQQEIENAQMGLGQADNALSRLSAETGDLLVARGAMRDALIDRTQQEIASLAMGAGGVEQLEAANALIEELEQEKSDRRIADLAAEFGTTVEQHVSRERTGRRTVVNPLRAQLEEEIAARQKVEGEAQLRAGVQEDTRRGRAFLQGFRLRSDVGAPREQRVEGLQSMQASADNLEAGISRMERIIGEMGGIDRILSGRISTEERRRLDAEVGSARLQLQQGIKGVPSDRDQQLIDRMIGTDDVGTLLGSFVSELGSIKQAARAARANFQGEAEAAGFVPETPAPPPGARVRGRGR